MIQVCRITFGSNNSKKILLVWAYQSLIGEAFLLSPLYNEYCFISLRHLTICLCTALLGSNYSIESGWGAATATPWCFSFAVILLQICCCVWTPRHAASPSLCQPLAVAQTSSQLTLEYFDTQTSTKLQNKPKSSPLLWYMLDSTTAWWVVTNCGAIDYGQISPLWLLCRCSTSLWFVQIQTLQT